MGRKRLTQNKKRVAFNISIEKQILDEFKEKVKEHNESASRVIERYILDYLNKK